jgi:hypothetical protein
MESMVRRLTEANRPAPLWQHDEVRTEISIHHELLEFVDWLSADVALVYSDPRVEIKNPKKPIVEDNLISRNSVVYQQGGWSLAAIESWRKHYLQKISMPEAIKYLFQNHHEQGKPSISGLQRQIEELKKVAAWEEVESGLPEVF